MQSNFKVNSRVSIIIPFVEFNSYVYECVLHCLDLNYPDFEIILLPDNKIELPEKLISRNIKTVETGNKNIAFKRNIGINNAAGNFYAFIDSDAYPTRDWLENAVKTFTKNTDIWAVGGPNITPPNDNLYKRCVGNSLKSFFVSGANSFRKKIAHSRYCYDLPSCNLIVNKQAIEELKGFNENLFTGEDIELCMRIISNKKKIFYNNKVIVYHHNRSLFKPYFLQRVTYGSTVFASLKEDIFREHISFHTVSFLLPMFFLLFIIAGGIISFFSNTFLFFYLAILIFYSAIIVIESIKYSEHIKEVPLTFLSLLIGNVSPGIGSLRALLGVKTNLKSLYKNYDNS
ncbi:MAG: glycosyltransferase [Nitrospiraceae bacterium]|nr:MAG: glycosyltransferase [Nitrospiraceae bacterium]